MSETKFTPGPWKKHDGSYVCAEAGNEICVSSIEAGCGCCSGDPREEDLANAALIAASPEMYEALEGLLNLTDQGREGGLILSRWDHKPITNGDQDIIDRAYLAAQAAIRKALGEAS